MITGVSPTACVIFDAKEKSAFLWNLVELSYTMECEPEDWEGIQLERYIAQEKNPELKATLEDLNEFLFW
jgi:hypothetical protein